MNGESVEKQLDNKLCYKVNLCPREQRQSASQYSMHFRYSISDKISAGTDQHPNAVRFNH